MRLQFLKYAWAGFLCALIAVAAPQGVRAGPELDQAVALWLSGDDAQSLPILADLARGGDSEARLLLARIETGDLGPSPFRLSLGAAGARALFRNIPAERSFGPGWIATEAEAGNSLAALLARSVHPEPDPALIAALHAAGEAQATDYPTRIVALHGSDEMRQALRESPALLPELRPYLDYLSETPEPRGDGLAALRHIVGPQTAPAVVPSDPEALGMAGILALGYGFGDISPENAWRPAVENWLLTAPAMAPLAGACRAKCGAANRACAFTLLALNGGYFEAIRLDSPLESVISQERFLYSPRARLMAVRRATLARTETNLKWLGEPGEIAALSQCAADLIAETRQEYGTD